MSRRSLIKRGKIARDQLALARLMVLSTIGFDLILSGKHFGRDAATDAARLLLRSKRRRRSAFRIGKRLIRLSVGTLTSVSIRRGRGSSPEYGEIDLPMRITSSPLPEGMSPTMKHFTDRYSFEKGERFVLTALSGPKTVLKGDKDASD